jgi:hypothetical protein
VTTALAIRDEQHYIATVSEVRALAERCEHVADAKDLADRARALEVYAERAKLGVEKVNLAAAARLWAERRAGELLAESAVGSGRPTTKVPARNLLPENVTKKESHRWQKLAAIPDEEFAEAVDEMVPEGRVTYAEIERRTKRRGRETAKREHEAQLVRRVNEEGGATFNVETCDIRAFAPGTVDAIVTDPPYITADAIDLYTELRDFAVENLRPHGALVAMTWQPILPDVLRALEHPRLAYRWTVAWVSGAHESTADHARRVFDRWKPVLVYHLDGWHEKTGMLTDVVSSGRDSEKGEHEWQQGLDGFRQLVRAVTEPGAIVCDPFVGGGTTALAAVAEHRHFIGCDIDEGAVATTERRLAA